MRARRLLESASYNPQQLQILRKAFDAAWEQIAPQLRGRGVEVARLKLANAVLSAAMHGPIEVERITADAMDAMMEEPTELGISSRVRTATPPPK